MGLGSQKELCLNFHMMKGYTPEGTRRTEILDMARRQGSDTGQEIPLKMEAFLLGFLPRILAMEPGLVWKVLQSEVVISWIIARIIEVF
jgi:hypothetical protein